MIKGTRVARFEIASTFRVTPAQAVLLPTVLAAGVLALASGFGSVGFASVCLFFVVTLYGLWLCRKTARALDDPRLLCLGDFWLIKLLVTLFLLRFGWVPQLDPLSSPAWGYDPQRYYQSAWDLVLQGWVSYGLEQNYQGILYYYGAAFALFGWNPIVPAIVNCFVTLLGARFLIDCAYSAFPSRTARDYQIAYLLLVPEVLWYDVMTSRETLMAALIIFATLGAGRYFVGAARATGRGTTFVVCTALFAILAVRTSMAIPVVAAIAVLATALPTPRAAAPLTRIALIAVGAIALAAGPAVQQLTGGYDIDYLATLDRLQTGEQVRQEEEWNQRSIGLLLVPSNFLESVIFLGPRMILYLAAPLPSVSVSLDALVQGSWGAWQRVMTIPTSLMMLATFPYLVAASSAGWRNRRIHPSGLLLPVAFWSAAVAVAGGNIIIHERYRVMFTMLFFACAWIGYAKIDHQVIKRWASLWFSLLFSGLLFYIFYKLLS